jgi:glycine/D-amino acid oxidase-like deaminating enzyme
MTTDADAVVIGSGALGASTAFYLAEQNRRVVLVDKFDLASQSSSRAAGLAQQVQVDDVLASLAIRGIQTLTHFEDETGIALDVVVNGSLKIARTESDALQLEEEVRRGKNLGVEIDLVSAVDARRAAPWANAERALAISHCSTDTYLEDSGALPQAFIRGFVERGGQALPHAAVTDVVLEDDTVAQVTTSEGPIDTPIVVDAAGAWARIIGDLVGRLIPLWPVRAQLLITEPRAEVEERHATVRVMDAKVYARPAGGGLMFGAYEPDPFDVDTREQAADFQMADLTLDIGPLRHAITNVRTELPLLEHARVAELRGGLPTMTPDGHFLVDQMPGVEGFYVASGCNAGGLSISPPLGADLAGWIVTGGERPDSLTPHRIGRFDDRFENDEELREACLSTYVHKYDEEEVQAR